jgi:branched-chain amino acid transport system permease protein
MEGFLIFSISVLTLAFVYAILCLALNIECGVAGMWDLGIVSYFGVGAYSYAILVAPAAASYQHYLFGFEMNPIFGILLAVIMGGISAYLIGLPSLRLRREYFLITTIAFSEVLRITFSNENWLTNGVAGIYNIEQPLKTLFSPDIYLILLFIVFFIFAIITYLLVSRLSYSTYGLSLKALRENEALAKTARIEPSKQYHSVYVFTGCLAGLSGALYVWLNTLVVPTQFTPNVTFFVWTALIIGGIGNNKGAFLGAIFFVILLETLSFLNLSAELALVVSSLRIALVGLALILILRFLPNGLISEKPRLL